MFGFLNVNKPRGITSRQVVDRVQSLVAPLKAGHAGTLDPLATGVLLIGVGAATRLVGRVHRLPKQYRATFQLGVRSDTEDSDGTVVALANPRRPERTEIEAAAQGLVGEIWQRPPAFSALKIAGRRAYDMARRGESPELAPRRVRVDRLEVVTYAYPELCLDIQCGAGTYVRSLGRDLAQLLGTGAVMTQLTRRAIGHFELPDSYPLDQLDATTLPQRIIPPAYLFQFTQTMSLGDDEVRRVLHGQTLHRAGQGSVGELPAVDRHGRLVAILVPRGTEALRPLMTFPYGS